MILKTFGVIHMSIHERMILQSGIYLDFRTGKNGSGYHYLAASYMADVAVKVVKSDIFTHFNR